ncbi:MAG: hypothetical protein ACI9IT_000367, partial [Glaciecola sp.]
PDGLVVFPETVDIGILRCFLFYSLGNMTTVF